MVAKSKTTKQTKVKRGDSKNFQKPKKDEEKSQASQFAELGRYYRYGYNNWVTH